MTNQTDPECNCGRRGTQREGHCIFCQEKNITWRIAVQVRQIINAAGGQSR